MGDYIKTAVEVLGPDGWFESEASVFSNDPSWPGHDSSESTRYAFFWQNYTMYSLFADVRTRDLGIVPIAPGRGLPSDASDSSLLRLLGGWSHGDWFFPVEINTVADKVANRQDDAIFGLSWVSAAELNEVDYDVLITSINEPIETVTLRNALGTRYFQHLDQLAQLGKPDNVRLLFCFTQ